MKVWDIEEIRTEICEYLAHYKPLKIRIDKLIFETTDTHVLDVIGESL